MTILSKTEKDKIKKDLLLYIEEHDHEDEEFDYIRVSNQLSLSYKQVFKLLTELCNEEKIVFQQKYLRKPIILSLNDSKNLYWKVHIRSKKHPKSRLGELDT